jgi:thiamine kinase-like enzyme
MIPENKQAAVKKALQSAFGVSEFENIELLTKGLSTALIFRIEVKGVPYLLRVITRTDAMGDPSYYFERMKAGADAGLAPFIHYLSVEDRISITDFIIAQPFPLQAARAQMAEIISRLHALPKFPFRVNYFDAMDGFIAKFRSGNAIPGEYTKELFDRYEKLREVYPRFDEENLVSCHNDLKPENFIFDGRRPWLIDWEGAFLNDRYEDLVVVGNFVTKNEAEEKAYLQIYFGEPASEYQLARFYLMTQMMHVFYFMFFMKTAAAEKPIDIDSIREEDFRSFHDRIWIGEIDLANTDSKIEYAWAHRRQFLENCKSKRFEGALRLIQKAFPLHATKPDGKVSKSHNTEPEDIIN